MTKTAAVIGAGPAGLMAAEVLSAGGVAVTVYDRMPSVGRKFLMAGRGGLNLTHSERLDIFLARYGAAVHASAPDAGSLHPARTDRLGQHARRRTPSPGPAAAFSLRP